MWFYSVVVITRDSDLSNSRNPGSNPGRTSFFVIFMHLRDFRSRLDGKIDWCCPLSETRSIFERVWWEVLVVFPQMHGGCHR